MSNPFGGFVHTSPLSSLPHDPFHSLASNIIRDYFGPTVQTVADCLLSRCCSGGLNSNNSRSLASDESPGLTLAEIEARIVSMCRRTLSEDRLKLVKNVSSTKNSNFRIHMAKGPAGSGYVVEQTSMRAALIVLIQHSLVIVCKEDTDDDENNGGISSQPIAKTRSANKHRHEAFRYKFDPDRARLIPRYPRYVEHAREAIDDNAAAVVEQILMQGRMRAEDVLRATTEHIHRFLAEEKEDEDDNDDNPNQGGEDPVEEAEKAEIRSGVLRSFKHLVDGGYIHPAPYVRPPPPPPEDDSNERDNKRKRSDTEQHPSGTSSQTMTDATQSSLLEQQDVPPAPGMPPDDTHTLALLRKYPNSRTFPTGSVWRVNVHMFHDVHRALMLGNLVKERYEQKVPAAGSIITAALKLAAYEEHAPQTFALSGEERQRREEEKGIFTPDQIMDYLPTTVLHEFKNRAGGGKSNIHIALVTLSQMDWPQVIMEVEGGRFELATRQLIKYLHGRLLHQVIVDQHGEVAARICSLLEVKGYLESEAIAKAAMVPAQDAREYLHQLYRTKYISLLSLQQNKVNNPLTAIYLWTVDKARLAQTVNTDVCTAYLNLRLRRQHEMDVGKDWIERAKEAGASDENEHEEDKANYKKFCEGLLRLDSALLQLDETIMVLRDF